MEMSEKRKRAELTIRQKLEIIAACEGLPKRSFAAVAKKFNVDRSTVSKIYKNKDAVAEVARSSNMNRKRQRSSKVEDVDEALYRWFVGATATDSPVSGEILRGKAGSFAQEFGVEGFLASNGWLDRWKKRYNVAYKRARGEESERWSSSTLSDVLERYEANDVYNAVETVLCWRAVPNGSEIFKGQGGGKTGRDRVTVLVCASMAGEKRPLMVIGKSEMTRCLRNVRSLPVQYSHNGTAGMTSAIFEMWLRAWDKELALGKRKIALIVDNCAAHAGLQFPHIELVLLPANSTAFLQPCHQGIVRALKRHYRRLIVLRLLAAIESSDRDVSGVQLIRRIDLLGSVRLLKESWDLVGSDIIVNCFRKAKFHRDNGSISSLDPDVVSLNKAESDFDFETFVVDVDGDEICTESNVSGCSEEINDENEADAGPAEMVVTKATAVESLEILEMFLCKGGIQDWGHFNKLEAQVQHLILRNATRVPQTSLKKLFKLEK